MISNFWNVLTLIDAVSFVIICAVCNRLELMSRALILVFGFLVRYFLIFFFFILCYVVYVCVFSCIIGFIIYFFQRSKVTLLVSYEYINCAKLKENTKICVCLQAMFCFLLVRKDIQNSNKKKEKKTVVGVSLGNVFVIRVLFFKTCFILFVSLTVVLFTYIHNIRKLNSFKYIHANSLFSKRFFDALSPMQRLQCQFITILSTSRTTETVEYSMDIIVYISIAQSFTYT